MKKREFENPRINEMSRDCKFFTGKDCKILNKQYCLKGEDYEKRCPWKKVKGGKQ